MPSLVTRCSKTGEEVSLGLEVDLNSFSLLPDIPIKFGCSACGKIHSELAGNGRLRNTTSEDLIEAITQLCEQRGKASR